MSFHPSKYIDEYYFEMRDPLTVILLVLTFQRWLPSLLLGS